MREEHGFDLGTLGGRIGHALMETVGPNKQGWLAKSVGAPDRTSVSRWISNRTPPKPEHLKAIVEALSISGHWLLTGEGMMYEVSSLAVKTMGQMERLLRNYLSAARPSQDEGIGFGYLDTDLRFLEINPWLAGINGLPVSEHIGKKLSEILPHVAEAVEGQMRQVLDTGESIINGLAHTVDAGGVERFYRHDYYAARAPDNTIVGVKCVVREIAPSNDDLPRK